jgi:hypothetical protein
MAQTRTLERTAWIAAIALFLFLARVELTSDDTGIIAGLIFLSACALALLQPRHALRWGLIIGLAIPAAELYAVYFGTPRSGFSAPKAVAGILPFALAIAMIGAYIGAGVRKLIGLFTR